MGDFDIVTSVAVAVGILVVIFGGRAILNALSSGSSDQQTAETHEFKECPSCGWSGKVSKFHKKCSNCGSDLI